MEGCMVYKTVGCSVINKKTIIQSDQDTSLFRNQDGSHHFAGTVLNGDLFKLSPGLVKTVDTIGGANPKVPPPVVSQAVDVVVGQMVGIGQIGSKNGDFITVIPA